MRCCLLCIGIKQFFFQIAMDWKRKLRDEWLQKEEFKLAISFLSFSLEGPYLLGESFFANKYASGSCIAPCCLDRFLPDLVGAPAVFVIYCPFLISFLRRLTWPSLPMSFTLHFVCVSTSVFIICLLILVYSLLFNFP